MSLDALREAGRAARERTVELCRDLVRIPSFSGEEGDAAERTAEEMRGLGYDEVEIDRAGNCLGLVKANAAERLDEAVLLNAHLDVVAVDEEAPWPHPPFEAAIEGGRLWGRGATDTKSAVAAQVAAGGVIAALQREGRLERQRDLLVAAVVQEEVGGLGTACLLEDRGAGYRAAVIGEPSGGALSFGHRGRVELRVRFHGKAAHASRPDWGINPHESLARFVLALEELERDRDERFGSSSVAPTLVWARPDSINVIPSQVELVLDWRNVPGESPATIRERVTRLAERAAGQGVRAEVLTPVVPLTSWRGVTKELERVSQAFGTDPEGELFRTAHRALEEGLGREVATIRWDFASDGGWLQAAGVPCLGYGPGDMQVMHAVQESCSLDLLAEAVTGYAVLAQALDS